MSDPLNLDPTAATIIDFLRRIGLRVRWATIDGKTFLPGLHLESGGLVVDAEKLKYPGDLLHEAGHLAVMPADRRATTGPDPGEEMGEEIGAQCWSYAAAVHLGLPPEVVFHSDGYKGSAETLIASYRSGVVGVPLLQWMELTLDQRAAGAEGRAPYPAMQKWLRS